MNFLGVLSSRLQTFNMKIKKARWQYGLHRIITETKSVINQSSAKGTLPTHFWSVPSASDFSIRGRNYLQDRKKFLPKNHSENLLPSIGYSTTEKYLMSVHFRMAHSNLLLRNIAMPNLSYLQLIFKFQLVLATFLLSFIIRLKRK